MRLLSIELTDWRAYEHCGLEFPDGLIGVVGPNGAGKTTIAEAIGWALFGKLRAGAKVAELRRDDGTGRPTAELVFALGEVIYRIRRVAGGDCHLWIGDGDSDPEASGATNVSRRIARELELPWEVFRRTVFAEQKDVAALDPKATGPTRRAHVERLLGLTRFKRAADHAKGRVKEIENEIQGRLAELEDPDGLKAELAEAEKAAERDSPRVKEFEKKAAAAKRRYDAARKAVENEHDRVKKAAVLNEQRSAAEDAATAAEKRVKRLQSQIAERERGRARLEKIDPDASQAAAAQKTLERWDELADAKDELDEARDDLNQVGHDPHAATKDEKTKEALLREQDALRTSVAELKGEVVHLERRVPALRQRKAVGASSERKEELRKAREDERRIAKQLTVLAEKLRENQEHLAAVEQGGPHTPCQLCKKPYGDEYEEIVGRYREDIADAGKRIPELESALEDIQSSAEHAEERWELAREAEKDIAATEGPSTLSHGERRLAKAKEQLERDKERLLEVDELLPVVGDRVKATQQSGRAWEAATGVVRERERRVARAAKTLGVSAYKAAQHDQHRKRTERLTAIAREAEALRSGIAAAAGLDKEAATEADQAKKHRDTVGSHAETLKKLNVKTGELPRLQEQCREAEEFRDGLTVTLTDAKLEAQSRSHEVKDYRRRLKAVQKAMREADKRRNELRTYQIVADLLERFREHEAQRAWPHLHRGASALLAAATDGRYADIRLSSDYRLTIVDRGSEHGLSRYSGGEQDLANLCLRLAIAEWVAKERGADIGLLVLDEVFGSQDEDRQRLLMDQLRALSTRFRQVLIITHVRDIADVCDSRIEVSTDEELSSKALIAA